MKTTLLFKTEAGQRELRERQRVLARSARTLLVLVDGKRDSSQLLQMVQGSSEQDLQLLLDEGLVSKVAPLDVNMEVPAPAAVAEPMPTPAVAAAPVDAPPTGLGYRELYDSLTALVKQQLGLIKGFKFALEIEKAKDLEELRGVAQRFVVEVEKAKGETSAQMARRALGLIR